jgi:hypothetical protein
MKETNILENEVFCRLIAIKSLKNAVVKAQQFEIAANVRAKEVELYEDLYALILNSEEGTERNKNWVFDLTTQSLIQDVNEYFREKYQINLVICNVIPSIKIKSFAIEMFCELTKNNNTPEIVQQRKNMIAAIRELKINSILDDES